MRYSFTFQLLVWTVNIHLYMLLLVARFNIELWNFVGIIICVCNPMEVELQANVLHMRYSFFKFCVILEQLYLKTNMWWMNYLITKKNYNPSNHVKDTIEEMEGRKTSLWMFYNFFEKLDKPSLHIIGCHKFIVFSMSWFHP